MSQSAFRHGGGGGGLLSRGRTLSLPREQETVRLGEKRKDPISETDLELGRQERKGN